MNARTKRAAVPKEPDTPERKARVREITEACDLAVRMVLVCGGSPATAYRVAADLAYGLEDDERKPRWRER